MLPAGGDRLKRLDTQIQNIIHYSHNINLVSFVFFLKV
jgi:hypothetical protein